VTLPFFTVGHSSHGIEAFAELLRQAQVELLVDIRKIPMSRANPQFNAGALPGELAASRIAYEHIAALGGLRGKARALPADVNGFWTNDSFHNYADYALSEPFHAGLEQLLDEGRKRRCAIMCSEAVWWRCHRRIVTDYLIASGQTVFHIMGPNRIEPAHLTAGAVVRPDKTIVYPVLSGASEAQRSLDL
jgi:uncharacterized protein (DUF488 family)